jgi:histidinol-phosphate aminotransferase
VLAVADLATGPDLLRPGVRAIEPVAHGSVPAAELAAYGLRLADVVDFSVNTNPLGPAPSVLAAVAATDWTRYPGDDEGPLCAAIATRCGVRPDQVVLGNGSAQLLWLVCLAALAPGRCAAVLGPTFGEYARAVRAVGAAVREVQDPDGAAGAHVLFVCNPNNPTSAYLGRAEVERLLAAAPGRLLVLDEAYAAFVAERWPAEPLLAQPNLVILRSMTKDHALPGLRIGYALAAPEVARALEAVRPPWSVNAGALRAGLAAFGPEAEAHLARARALVARSRALLAEGFAALGYAVAPPAANFVLVQVGDGAAFRRALLPRGRVVRDCASFGLPRHVRVACRLPAECLALLDAVREMPRP